VEANIREKIEKLDKHREHYADFSQTADNEVIALLDEAKKQLQK
jgi:predicted phosphoribosyltransferase